MTVIIQMPRVNANDDSAMLVEWLAGPGDAVRRGDFVALAETTKATVDIEAPNSGYLRILVEEGRMVAVGEPIAEVVDSPEAALRPVVVTPPSDLGGGIRLVSKNARRLLELAGLDAAELPGVGPLREAEVRRFLDKRTQSVELDPLALEQVPVFDDSVLLWGAADQGAVVVDALRESGKWKPLAFIDETPRDSEFEGAPVWPPEALPRLKERNVRFAHVCIGSPQAKIRVAERLKDLGYQIVSIVHPRAVVSSSAQIGEGVYVGPGVVVGPHAVLGDYSQVNNNATVPHHTRLGVGVRVSDGANLAGGVVVGDRAYIGLGVTVNTGCAIGADATLVSGVAVFDNVPDGAVVRARTTGR